MLTQLMTVKSPWFEAGIVVQDNLIVRAQPPIHWAEGRSLLWLSTWLARRGWRLHEVANHDSEEPLDDTE